MAVRIAHASIDERGKASGGQAGDQTGKEVCIRTWYNANWNVLLRPKDRNVANKMVTFATAVCNGNMVGYDQGQRNSLRDVARAAGWDGAKLATKCETDCSAFLSVAAEAAGINMDAAYTNLGNGVYNAPVTWTMRKTFVATGAFVALTEAKYLTTSDYLMPGDVLVRESGHTAMAIDYGAKAAYDSEMEATSYEVTTKSDPLNVRDTPGGSVIGAFPRGEVIIASRASGDWLYCTNGTLTGWCSSAYLTKVEEATPKQEEVEDMDLSKLTDKDAYTIVEKAMRYAELLATSEWAVPELDDAIKAGITDGQRPRAFTTREETAIMVLRATKTKG